MGKTATNISVVLGLITVAFAGYYLYTQQATSVLSFETNEQTMQSMLRDTEVFIARENILKKVVLDVSLFEDDRFRLLRDFTAPIEERPVGRPNPFEKAKISSVNNF